jgi:DNA-binding transcriptional MerR regulator
LLLYTAPNVLQELTVPHVEIPKRALFKSSEVCEIASVQPYVLRSWESEFPDLGVTKSSGGQRVYRREDVERVLRIKHLVFSDGLTLAGVRRRIDEEAPPVLDEADATQFKELLGRNAKERLTEVKRGLQAILAMLSTGPSEQPIRASARVAPPSKRKNGGQPAKSSGKKLAKRRK